MQDTDKLFMKIQTENNSKEIAHYVFSGSTTMIGVCITVISLFRIMKLGKETYADEILGIDTFLFILSCFLSYLTLRNEKNKRLERIADFLFFAGLSILLLVGLMIVFSAY